jgi:hypothetical protein
LATQWLDRPEGVGPPHLTELDLSIGKWGWKPREVVRAIEAAHKGGLTVTGITIVQGGGVTINTSNDAVRQPADPAGVEGIDGSGGDQ